MTTQPEGAPVPADSFELRLAIARFEAGRLSAAEAGRLVGVSGQTWRNWEAGDSTGARKPAMLRYIAEQLGVDEQWLRDGGPLLGEHRGPGRGPGRPMATVSRLTPGYLDNWAPTSSDVEGRPAGYPLHRVLEAA